MSVCASWFARLALLLLGALSLALVSGCGRSSLFGNELIDLVPGDAGPSCNALDLHRVLCEWRLRPWSGVRPMRRRRCGVRGLRARVRPGDVPTGRRRRSGRSVRRSPSRLQLRGGRDVRQHRRVRADVAVRRLRGVLRQDSECVAGTTRHGVRRERGGRARAAEPGLSCAPSTSGGGVCTSLACTPDNCAGCCSATGCNPGTLLSACGTGGQACQACTGSQCAPAGPGNGGVCVATGCNAQNCPGCCDKNGLCQAGDGTSACGRGGDACSACSASQVCAGGACATPTVCGPQSCAGCCAGSTCVGGGANDACGSGGGACQDCGTTATCVANVCQTLGPCDASSCPTGCCNGNLCLPGMNDSACGSGGAACSACGAGTQCAAGSCQAGASCGPSNCSGCCANNTCVGGASDERVRARRQPVPGVRDGHRVREWVVRSDVRGGLVLGVLPGRRLRPRRPGQCVRDRRGRLPELRSVRRVVRERHVRRAALRPRDVLGLLRRHRNVRDRLGSGGVWRRR